LQVRQTQGLKNQGVNIESLLVDPEHCKMIRIALVFERRLNCVDDFSGEDIE